VTIQEGEGGVPKERPSRARVTEETKFIFTTADICELFEISRETLSRWEKKGAPKEGRGKWNIKAVMEWRFKTDSKSGEASAVVRKLKAEADLKEIKKLMGANDGDLVLILSGDNANKTRVQLCALRLEMGNRLGLRDKNVFKCLWIVDFPLFEWSDEEQRLMATHHPFTMPNPDDIPLLDEHPEQVRAKAYDFVCNGIEVGGGSLRIHDTQLQEKMFEVLGFTKERAEAQFGFLMNAFKYGAPPHAGLAFGLDRFVSIFAGLDSIRDCIAFPKNNSGRDVMLDAPGELDQKQLDELQIKLNLKA